jgi:hypothetical protein
MMDRCIFMTTLALASACFDPAEPDTACFDDTACKGGRICSDRRCVAPDENAIGMDENSDESSGDESGMDDAASGEGSDGSAMNECVDAGQSCEANGDCCGFGTQSAGCVQLGSGLACSDMCEANAGCASGCCSPLLTNDEPAGYAGCLPADYCQTTPCGGASCVYDWCALTPGNCPPSFFGDGSCDCGCQFFDIDCE